MSTEQGKTSYVATVRPGEVVLDPELIERFDRAFAFLVGKTATENAWKPIPELKVFLYGPKGESTPYSPSMYYEPQEAFARRSHLEQPPDLKRFNASKSGLAVIEELINQINQPE